MVLLVLLMLQFPPTARKMKLVLVKEKNLQITIWSGFHLRHLTANLDCFLLFSVMQSVASLL